VAKINAKQCKSCFVLLITIEADKYSHRADWSQIPGALRAPASNSSTFSLLIFLVYKFFPY
jgi:hypothetical protein